MSQLLDGTPVDATRMAVVFDLFRTLICPELDDPAAYRRVDRVAEALGLELAPLSRWFASEADHTIESISEVLDLVPPTRRSGR